MICPSRGKLASELETIQPHKAAAGPGRPLVPHRAADRSLEPVLDQIRPRSCQCILRRVGSRVLVALRDRAFPSPPSPPMLIRVARNMKRAARRPGGLLCRSRAAPIAETSTGRPSPVSIAATHWLAARGLDMRLVGSPGPALGQQRLASVRISRPWRGRAIPFDPQPPVQLRRALAASRSRAAGSSGGAVKTVTAPPSSRTPAIGSPSACIARIVRATWA